MKSMSYGYHQQVWVPGMVHHLGAEWCAGPHHHLHHEKTGILVQEEASCAGLEPENDVHRGNLGMQLVDKTVGQKYIPG